MNMVDCHSRMMAKLGRALRLSGDLYSVSDILDGIQRGQFQSFVSGDSWAITQVLDFPRARVLQIFLVVGTMENMDDLEGQVTAFGREIGAKLIQAHGRNGWKARARNRKEWRTRRCIFTKEL